MSNTAKTAESKVNANNDETNNTKQQQEHQDIIQEHNETSYNNAMNEFVEEAGVNEVSFSSISGHAVYTPLLQADNNNELTKFTSSEQQQHIYEEGSNILNEENSTPTSIFNTTKNSYFVEEEEEESSCCDPPPLVLPPPGTVQYDDSFIEMVQRIVNRNRAADSNNNTDDITNNDYNNCDDDQSQESDGGDSRRTNYDNSKLSFSSKNEEESELDEEHSSSSSLKVIEKARRVGSSPDDDDDNSVVFFLRDDNKEIPSFFLCDRNEEEEEKEVALNSRRAKELKESLSQKSENSNNNSSLFKECASIQWDDELDKSCNSIEAIDLGVEKEEKENVFDEQHSCQNALENGEEEEEEENQLLFEKDYSSLLCFDDVYGYVTFKKNSSNNKDNHHPKATTKLKLTDKEIQEVNENAVVLARPANTSRIENQLQIEESIHTISKVSQMKYINEEPPVETIKMTNNDKLREKATRNIKSSFDDIVDAIYSQSSSNKRSPNIRSNKDNQEHVLDDIDAFVQYKTLMINAAAKDKTSNNAEMKRKVTTTNIKHSIVLEKSEEDHYINSSSSSLNIEDYIIATSTPVRDDSQQQTKDELFKTTPIKRRSQHQEDDTEYSKFDCNSSPIRRRLLEAHSNDRERYTTPSPPFTFHQKNNN